MSEERLRRIEDRLKFLIQRILLLEIAIRKTNELGISKGLIHGVLNGMEPEDINLIKNEYRITKSQIEIVENILRPIYNDREKLKNFDDYNTIKKEAEQHSISEAMLRDILKYLRGIDAYRELLDKLKIENPENSTFSGY